MTGLPFVMSAAASSSSSVSPQRAGAAALTLGALGVVFGDIGTSPLYAMQTVFGGAHHAIPVDRAGVFGVISLVFWSVMLVVCVKYLTFIMRADNDGEGGIMALIALVQRAPQRKGAAGVLLVLLGVFGASLFYGDGMITPAISVLSAVEGLKVISPSFEHIVVPVTLTILAGLFFVQRYGTGAVGRAFGPVMLVWFSALGALGAVKVAADPEMLLALSPSYAVRFFLDAPLVAFLALGSVVLAVTGAEALYADMGHFGAGPIRRAWFWVAFPALTLNYLGQGALIIASPHTVSNPFFLLVPESLRIPMVVLATAATVIASQAVISGAFSVTRQAVQLGFLPRLQIRHTSEHEIGQVYVPAVNWAIFGAVVALVVGFGSSAALASAYGIAVTGTLAIDTLLFGYVMRNVWRRPMTFCVTVVTAFLLVDLAFFSANVPKVAHGGWFPLAIAAAVFCVLATWQRGRQVVTERRTGLEGPLRPFIDDLHAEREAQLNRPRVRRVHGTAVFLNPSIETTPLAMRANVEHNHVLHRHVIVVSVQTCGVPHVDDADRLRVDDLGYADDGIFHVTVRFGFQDDPDVPRALELLRGVDGEVGDIDLTEATYFLSKITIRPTDAPTMRQWRKRLFVTLSRHAASPVGYYRLPVDRTVSMGSSVAL